MWFELNPDLKEISDLLDGFDTRVVENILQGFEKSHPNANMLDFGVTVMGETYGRERRHRWFTFKGYKALLNQENISEAEHGLSVDLANTGGFTDTSPDLFYDTLDRLHQHQDTEALEETTKKKRKPPKNPILPDGTVKRGRPRKNQPGTSKRKREDTEEGFGEDDQAHPSKRVKATAVEGQGVVEAGQSTVVEPRKRGRPPKRKPEGELPTTPTPRKRGRPPKISTPMTVEKQGGEQTQPTPNVTVPAPEVVPEMAHDETELPTPSYQETSGKLTQQGAAEESRRPAQPDAGRVRASYPM